MRSSGFTVKVFTRLHLLLSLGVCGFVLNFWSICDHPINRQQNIYADTHKWQCVRVCVFREPVSASKEFFTHYDLLISWIFLAYDCPVNNASFHLSLHLPQVATDDLKISLSTVSFQWLERYGFLAFVFPCPYTPHISWGSLHLSNPTLTILQREMCHGQVQKQDGDHYHFPVLS